MFAQPKRDIFWRVVSPEVREKLEYRDYSILINGPTAKALMGRQDVTLRSLGPIQVKGRAEPVDLYAVVVQQTGVETAG